MRTTPHQPMSKRKRKNHKRKAKAAALAQSALGSIIHPDAAGIDIGAEELVAAVPPGRGEGPQVRTFSAFTEGVHALRDWLLSCHIKTVAMESTGNYWLCACLILEDAGIEVCLVNARHVKGVPGKKTDVCDAVWLQPFRQAQGPERSRRAAPRRGAGARKLPPGARRAAAALSHAAPHRLSPRCIIWWLVGSSASIGLLS